MKGHYMKGKHIAEADSTLLDSGTWKWITGSKERALQYMHRIILNEKDTLIWHDAWLKGGKLLNQVSTTPTVTSRWMVSDIVEHKSWVLKDPELIQVWHKITQAPVLDTHTQKSDTLSWSPSKSGQFECNVNLI